MTIRTSGELLANIAADLADNNSGAISAADVRNNMADTVESINAIVASGDTYNKFAFFNDVKLKKTGGNGGTLYVESGILFPNAAVNNNLRQTEPWPGVASINHNTIGNLTGGDPHTQYLPVDGTRGMNGNLRLNSNWIGVSGQNGAGIKFVDTTSSGTQILTSGTFIFGDNSIIKSGRGIAKAWISFDGSGVASIPVVRSSYNITHLFDAGEGKYVVQFASGILGSNNYLAVGHSNARSTSASFEDFERNTVGIVARSGVDPNRRCSFAILNSNGQYVDGDINDLLIFENGPGVVGESVTVNTYTP